MIISIPDKTKNSNLIPAGISQLKVMNLPLLSGELNIFANWILYLVSKQNSTPIIIEHINLNNCFQIWSDKKLSLDLSINAPLIFDGIGMEIAALILGLGWHKSTNGTDLFPVVADMAQVEQIPIYFLGSSSEIVRRAVENIQRQFPRIVIVGYHSGYFSVEEEESIVMDINKSNARLLLVGLGVPKQDFFALRNRERLNVSAIWGVGGLFDFLSGAKPRAPLFLRKLRLEWLFRFALEPKRMWRRNIVIPPLFFAQVLKQAWISRFFNRA